MRYESRFKHDPDNGVYGDCFRCCVAAMLNLELDEVPHFLEDNPETEEFWSRVDSWLSDRGLSRGRILYPGDLRVDDILETLGLTMRDCAFGFSGVSSLGCEHQVVVHRGKIVVDPSGNEIVGPGSNGFYEVMVLLPKTEEKWREPR